MCIHYEPEDEEFSMSLNLTLPQKYAEGPATKVVTLFANHFKKKHGDNHELPEELHLEHKGEHISNTQALNQVDIRDDLYLVKGPAIAVDVDMAPAPAAPAPADKAKPATSGECSLPRGTAVKVKQGDKPPAGCVRCKRFGCNQYFNPLDEGSIKCVYHQKPPIFHETAKWWSCCNGRKAYDWEEFIRIPGCATGLCSTDPPEMRDQKKFLGGCDVRDMLGRDCAPVRLDGPAEVLDARKKLDRLKAGLTACGLEEALFDRCWGKMAAKHGDLDVVVSRMREEFTCTMTRMME